MIINLTPHVINIINIHQEYMNEELIHPSGIIARVSEQSKHFCFIGEVEIIKKVLGVVENLPEPKDGVFYIVSAMVRMAAPERKDILSPGDQVRDMEGKIIGCKNLVCNQ